MRPVFTILGLAALSLLLAGPVVADENHRKHGPGDDGHHPQDQPMDERFGGPMGPGGGCPMGYGMEGGMGPHGPMMMGGKHSRHGGHMGLNQDDWELVNELPERDDAADYSWHPNRLRRAAIDFIQNDVYRLAILPFHDVSQMGPLENQLDPSWSERVLRDTLAGALLETGILVLPAENTEAALVEMKAIGGDLDESDMGFQRRGKLIMSSLSQGSYSPMLIGETVRRVAESNQSMGLTSAGPTLSTVDLDYTPNEYRMLSDALDVDGFIIGSITHLGGDDGGDNVFEMLFSDSGSKLAATFYLIDAATGEPIYGKRLVIESGDSWWDFDSNDNVVDQLSTEFAGAVMRDLTHPVPMWYVQELRHRYGLEKHPPKKKKRLYGEVEPRHEDANLGDWRDVTTEHQKLDDYRVGKHRKGEGMKHHHAEGEHCEACEMHGDKHHGDKHHDDEDRDHGDHDDDNDEPKHLEHG